MPNTVKTLHAAKAAKNDEWYTLYEDVEKEMENYVEHFRGKTIYCPCDDFRWSAFVKYFRNNFERLGLKRLVATNYDIGEGAFDYSKDASCESAFRVDGSGDFHDYCGIRDEADIIVTNPPFSKWRDFFAWIREAGKDFIILGTVNVINYKGMLPLIKEKKLNMGFTRRGGGHITLRTADGNKEIANSVWWTSFPVPDRKPLELTERYGPRNTPFYDNYPHIINVDKVKDIPRDYYSEMGVPITFLDKWCTEQFDILRVLKAGYVAGKAKFTRLVIKRKVTSVRAV